MWLKMKSWVMVVRVVTVVVVVVVVGWARVVVLKVRKCKGLKVSCKVLRMEVEVLQLGWFRWNRGMVMLIWMLMQVTKVVMVVHRRSRLQYGRRGHVGCKIRACPRRMWRGRSRMSLRLGAYDLGLVEI